MTPHPIAESQRAKLDGLIAQNRNKLGLTHDEAHDLAVLEIEAEKLAAVPVSSLTDEQRSAILRARVAALRRMTGFSYDQAFDTVYRDPANAALVGAANPGSTLGRQVAVEGSGGNSIGFFA